MNAAAFPIVLSRRREGRLKIPDSVVETLWGFRQERADAPESGGILLGRHIVGGQDIVVDMVTTPLPGDRRGRTSFHRARRGHQAIADKVWAESSGTCLYLGEWHTHPESHPRPSWIDRLDWCRKVLFDTFAGPIFFLIIGSTSIAVWEGRRRSYPARLATVNIDGR